jgi:hypothetical protein
MLTLFKKPDAGECFKQRRIFMKKTGILSLAALLLLAGVLLTGCPQPVEDMVKGEGVFDKIQDEEILDDPDILKTARVVVWPSVTGEGGILTYDDMPPPSYWDSFGHQHAYPNIFRFADGRAVQTIADWELRRKEISRIVQYYEYGIVPSVKEEDGISVTVTNTGATASTVVLTHDASGRTQSFSLSATLGSALQVPENLGKLPLWAYGSVTSSLWGGGTISLSTTSPATLYGLDTSDPSYPSAMSVQAWNMSVLLTALEKGALGGYFDPNKVGVTGYSRNGKEAEVITALAEGAGGSRVGYVSIGSAGSGGPALERFVSPSGYKVEGKWSDPLPIGRTGLMKFEGLIGKPWYMKKINNGDVIGDWTVESSTSGTSDAYRYRTARGWAPYYEPYDPTPTNYSSAVTTPFVGWQSPAESWSGIQSLSEARNEVASWFSGRFQQFTDLHYGLDIDHVVGNETRGKYGILCTIPFDQYYLTALIAGPGRGIIFQDGYVVPRNNPESQFANWLIADEVYKFYGEAEGVPEKYIWNNAFMMTWGTHGGNTGNETADRTYHSMRVFNGEADTTFAKANMNLMKFRIPYFQVDDPISRFDYYRINWGRPGHPTIAERVHARVAPIVPDFEAGDALTDPPESGGVVTYPDYEPTGPKFKEMDWRGLIDTPEAL